VPAKYSTAGQVQRHQAELRQLGGRITLKSQDHQKLMTALNSWEEGMTKLGECIVKFQTIEEVLSACISAMIGRSRKIGKIVTAEMSYRARVSVYRALFVHHLGCDTLHEDVSELIKRLNWAEQERNSIVHSLWDASEEFPETIKRSKSVCRRQGLRIDEEHITPEEFEDLTNLFEGIVTDLIYLTELHLPRIKIKF
jgi:hypothetical protein